MSRRGNGADNGAANPIGQEPREREPTTTGPPVAQPESVDDGDGTVTLGGPPPGTGEEPS